MEYNTTLYKVFRWVKATDTFNFVKTFYSYTEASRFCNTNHGVYVIKEEESHD